MEIRKLWTRKTTAIFVWPGEEPLELAYDGWRFLVPPRFETAKPKEHASPYMFESARNAKNELMAGTILVSDIDPGPAGDGEKPLYRRGLNVQEMCAYFTRDRDDLFNRGFNIVTEPKEVFTAMEMGIPLYEASEDEHARIVISTEMERQRKFEAKGQPAPPSSSQHLVDWAIAHLRRRSAEIAAQKPAHSMETLRSILEGRFDTLAPPSTVPVEVKKFGRELYDEAKGLGVMISRAELEAIFEGNEDSLDYLRQKIRARRESKMEKRLEEEAKASASESATEEGVATT